MGGSGSNPSRAPDRPSSSRSPADSSGIARRLQILVVEDNLADVFLIREAIESKLAADLKIVEDGEQAIDFFEAADGDESIACPDLVILDINLPKKNGGQVLTHLRQSKRCATALVVVVTSSNSANDRETMSRFGANAYFRKPSAYLEFMKLGDVVQRLLGPQENSSD